MKQQIVGTFTAMIWLAGICAADTVLVEAERFEQRGGRHIFVPAEAPPVGLLAVRFENR